MKTHIYNIIVVAAILLITSCNSEENYLEVNVRGADFQANIDENPENNQVIGKVIGSTNIGTVRYSILSQSPENSFSINTSTGELYVNSPLLFNYELNPKITGVVKIQNEDVYKTINIALLLNDIDEVVAYDFETTIYETPFNGQVLGTLEASGKKESLNFSLLSQDPQNAITIDVVSGQIIVVDSLLFNFNLNQTISGKVRVHSSDAYDDAEILINMIDKENPGICHGNIILRNNTELEYFVAQNYHTVTGTLTITDDLTGNEIKSLEKLGMLHTVGGAIVIDSLEFLQDLKGLEALISIGGLQIKNNKTLLTVDALSNLGICLGDILILDNEVFEFYCGLQSIFINSPPFRNGSIEAKTSGTLPPPLPKIFTTHNNLVNLKVEEVMALDCD